MVRVRVGVRVRVRVGVGVGVGVRVRAGVRVGVLGELLLIFDSEQSRVGPFVGPRAAVGQRPTPQ